MYVNEYWNQFPEPELYWYYLSAIFVSITSLFNLVSNALALYYLFGLLKIFQIFLFKIQIKLIINFFLICLFSVKRDQNKETYFLLNLYIADIFKCIVINPMAVISSSNREWIFGQIGKSLLFHIHYLINIKFKKR